ncbi:MAG: hypothetical protein M0Z85_07525 [Gammaproteobacteria bacterium]|jgi:hypothetical protein|nr:hypothetical protein [Gammaproteobacteria bacterium]
MASRSRYDNDEVRELFRLCGWHSWDLFLQAVTIACSGEAGTVERIKQLNEADIRMAWEHDQQQGSVN